MLCAAFVENDNAFSLGGMRENGATDNLIAENDIHGNGAGWAVNGAMVRDVYILLYCTVLILSLLPRVKARLSSLLDPSDRGLAQLMMRYAFHVLTSADVIRRWVIT